MILPEPAFPGVAPPVESELVARARAGDAAAREELAREHRTPLYVFALQLLGDREDALDVAQEAMLRFFLHLHRFDVRRPVKPWLFQIVRNCVHDLHRRRRIRRHDSLDEPQEDGRRRELVDETVDPERDARQSQLRLRLWESLRRLSEPQREILVLRDYHDLSYAEIAAALDIPVGTVMSRLHGARKRLREHLQADLRSLST